MQIALALALALLASGGASATAPRAHTVVSSRLRDDGTFFEQSWGRQFAHLKANGKVSFEEFDELLREVTTPEYISEQLTRAPRGAAKRIDARSDAAQAATPDAANDADGVRAALGAGRSFVVRFEDVSSVTEDPRAAGLRALWDDVAETFVAPATLHLYESGVGGEALAPHTDTGDVLVLALRGAKEWQVCTPGIGGDDAAGRARAARAPDAASAAGLRELDVSRGRGCST